MAKGNESVRKFPEGLFIGTVTSSYQVEGAWNKDGKSENIWDHLSHKQPCLIKHCDTGDDANESYRLYKRDVEMIRELGLDFYRFSLSWTRLLPTSFPNVINEAGVQYYNNLINEMLKYNIKPMVTIYHWDLPQTLQELGGWSNPHMIDWFTDYAETVFELFGDRVKVWITINEPREICYQGYAGASMAPLLNISGYAEYLCAVNVLLAHASTWHVYNDRFKKSQNGIVGIAMSASWYEPKSDDHLEATEDLAQFEVVPWGFKKLLKKIREDYGNPRVVVTENGYSTNAGLNDDERIDYYRSSLDALLDAIHEGSDIRVYMAWSLMDNFEWMQGYSERFGLYEVDYKSPERTRTPRKSAYVFKEMMRTRTLNHTFEPDMSKPLKIDDGH